MTGRRALQIAVAIAGLVPVGAGLLGIGDPAALDLRGGASALTHAAYLSGLLLGIGLAFWALIPRIEHPAFAFLAAIVVVGGLARLAAATRLGIWTPSVTLPLAMELLVTPALWLWQRRIAGSSSPFG